MNKNTACLTRIKKKWRWHVFCSGLFFRLCCLAAQRFVFLTCVSVIMEQWILIGGMNVEEHYICGIVMSALGQTSLVLGWCCAHSAIERLYFCLVSSYLEIYIQIQGLLVVILAVGRVIPVVFAIKLFVATRRLYCVMCVNFGVTVNVLVWPTRHTPTINKLEISLGIAHGALLRVCHLMIVHF